MKKYLINLFILFLVLVAIGLVIEYNIDKAIKDECVQFQQWAQQIRRDVFYITPLQKEICDSVKVKINARISKGPLQYPLVPRVKEVRI